MCVGRAYRAVYRCDVCAQWGNCKLAGPPGALRHHKAYGTGVVPVLNPSWNTALRLTLPNVASFPSPPPPAPCARLSSVFRMYVSRSERDYQPFLERVSPNNYGLVTARGYLIISIYGKNLPDVRHIGRCLLCMFTASKSTTLNILPDDAKGCKMKVVLSLLIWIILSVLDPLMKLKWIRRSFLSIFINDIVGYYIKKFSYRNNWY